MKSTPYTADDKYSMSVEVAAERLLPPQKSKGLRFSWKGFRCGGT
jgi:hypothetical protein